MSIRGVQYTERVDAVIYDSPPTADFTRADWLQLALAALDQAGHGLGLDVAIKQISDVMADESEDSR